MSRFVFTDTALPGLVRIERRPVSDDRGFLVRLFCESELGLAGWNGPVAQINHTLTRKRGTVRGMHFQYPPYCEKKIVSCLRGRVLDVAVDLRKESPTFLQWYAEEISCANNRALLIPEGFAHGFQALSDDCELIYLHSVAYMPDAESGLHPLDSVLAVDWPLPITDLSSRDDGHPLLTEDFRGINP